jgi:hypothetical protein
MNRSDLAKEWDDYLLELREDAHQLLAWGYADTRADLSVANDEYEMTGLLAAAMEARRDSPQTPERFMLYSVHNEQPISPFGELGKRRPKLDIQIQRHGCRPTPHFTFEAKRLRDDRLQNVQKTMTAYLGDEGVKRFVASRYASESVEAAMLGCVQARDASYWFDQIDSAFEHDMSHGGVDYSLVAGLKPMMILSDLPDERVSLHTRASGAVIKLFHLFIDCR